MKVVVETHLYINKPFICMFELKKIYLKDLTATGGQVACLISNTEVIKLM